MLESIKTLLLRDVNRLKSEIESFSEDRLWGITGEISNSAGNLCLHLCGNLRYYIGDQLGGIPYIRNRDAEFSSKNLPKKQLLDEIGVTISSLDKALSHLPKETLKNPYPLEVLGYPMTIEYFLIHLVSHFNYHLGQINYLRRML